MLFLTSSWLESPTVCKRRAKKHIEGELKCWFICIRMFVVLQYNFRWDFMWGIGLWLCPPPCKSQLPLECSQDRSKIHPHLPFIICGIFEIYGKSWKVLVLDTVLSHLPLLWIVDLKSWLVSFTDSIWNLPCFPRSLSLFFTWIYAEGLFNLKAPPLHQHCQLLKI